MNINQKAPVVQAKDIFINANIELDWSLLTKIDQWPRWNKNIKKTYLQKAPAVGIAFTWQSNGSKIKSKIHTYDIHKAIGWSGEAFGAKAIHNWYLKPAEKGTKICVEESMEGWLVSLMKNKMNRFLEKDMTHWLKCLKVECEKVNSK